MHARVENLNKCKNRLYPFAFDTWDLWFRRWHEPNPLQKSSQFQADTV